MQYQITLARHRHRAVPSSWLPQTHPEGLWAIVDIMGLSGHQDKLRNPAQIRVRLCCKLLLLSALLVRQRYRKGLP